MPFGFLSISAHERLMAAERARYDTLFAEYAKLRASGATPRPEPRPPIQPMRSPEERLLEEARVEYERNAVAQLMAEGKTLAQATEAARIMREALDQMTPGSPLD